MRRFTNSKWFYRILALFFALLLFFNANHSMVANNTSFTQGKEDVYQEEIQGLPITWQYDHDKYYVTPATNSVDVTLESSNKVLLDTEVNPQTRQLKVIGDLTGKGPGTYEVRLVVKQLNIAVSTKLATEKVKVKIATKASKSFKVTSQVDQDQLSKGYQVSKVTLDPKTVQVTAGKSDLNKIDKVVAKWPSSSKLSGETATKKVELQAYDKEGNVVNASFSVPVVSMTVDLVSPSKSVPINLLQKGTLPAGIESYQFLCDTQSIELNGSQTTLANIKSLDTYIDISNIDQTKTKKITLNLPEGTTSNTKSINVTIVPIKAGEKSMDLSTEQSDTNSN